jgi:Big-like domain-containing protein
VRRRVGCRASLALGVSLAAAVSLASGGGLAPAPGWAAEVQSLFPSDRLTTPDPQQSTGRRVALPLPDCAADAAGCDEIRLLNELDGFSVNPRIAIRFSGPVALESLTRATAFLLPLISEPGAAPIGLAQLVWDGESNTVYARPERMLLQARRYALVLTTKVTDEAGQPLAPPAGSPLVSEAAHGISAQGLVLQRLKALGLQRQDLAAAAVFTTQSVTVGLEQMRAALESGPAPELRFALAPGGVRSAYARVELDRLELRRHVSTDPAASLEEPAALPLVLVPPTDVRTIAFGRFTARSFLTADRRIPMTATRTDVPAQQSTEDVDVTVYLPAGLMPRAGWPVAIFGHGFGNDRHVAPMTVAGTLAHAGFATVAINVVGHGGGPQGTLTVLRAGHEAVPLPAGGRRRQRPHRGDRGREHARAVAAGADRQPRRAAPDHRRPDAAGPGHPTRGGRGRRRSPGSRPRARLLLRPVVRRHLRHALDGDRPAGPGGRAERAGRADRGDRAAVADLPPPRDRAAQAAAAAAAERRE